MKFSATIAALALFGQVTAIKYDKSEGPTKVDLGEDDPNVVERADDSSNPKDAKWKKENPLSWTDDGDDDHVVLTMLDGSLLETGYRETKKFSSHHMSFGSVLTMVDGSMRPIYDEDGDGVEDNVKKTREELDRFYEPAVFHPAEDIHNTHHGNLPGHVRKAEYEAEPVDHWRIHF